MAGVHFFFMKLFLVTFAKIIIINHMKYKPYADYLKYWRVIKVFIRHKYKLSSSDVDILLFIYSEGYFRYSDFWKFEVGMTWEKDRLKRLIAEGWVSMWRPSKNGQAALYEASYKAKTMMTDIYEKIELKSPVSEKPASNHMFRSDASYVEKASRPVIRKMNRSRKEIKRLKDIEDQML